VADFLDNSLSKISGLFLSGRDRERGLLAGSSGVLSFESFSQMRKLNPAAINIKATGPTRSFLIMGDPPLDASSTIKQRGASSFIRVPYRGLFHYKIRGLGRL
jgi:hypothetical protein